MDLDRDRPHFRSSASSELFICFTSRLSSSSMKLSKSILSPGRAARDGGPASLSSSLSRRLRTNGSLKGGASPFFTTAGKKRGCAFENPEPSSPKVTCIGQVRVKTKKKVKRSRSVSKRQVSFRKIEQSCGEAEDNKHYQAQECLPHRNQRWVHLPISICEALRSEFSCLFPCKSSCFSREQKEGENGCGARWVVVGGGGEEEMRRSSRRHVFEDRVEFKGEEEEEEEGARVSICIPPKNALLLMRCRSDPIKMAALVNANRFSWPAPKSQTEDIQEQEEEGNNFQENVEQVEQVCIGEGEDEVFEKYPVLGEEQPNLEVEEVGELCHGDEEIGEEEFATSSEEMVEEKAGEEALKEEEDEEEEEMVEEKAEEAPKEEEAAALNEVEEEEEMVGEKAEEEALKEEEAALKEGEMVEEKAEEEALKEEEAEEEALKEEEEEEEEEEEKEEEEEEVESNMSSFEALLVQENTDNYEDVCPIQDDKEEIEYEECQICNLPQSTESDAESPPLLEDAATMQLEIEKKASISTEKDAAILQENQMKSNEEEKERQKVLPECLLLMMCEPKLSMEVSKETWVRWLPQVKKRLSIDSKPKAVEHHLPRRSSVSMAAMIEQKLVNAAAYEPFVLTRCKSEPMRTAAAKLLPESCFWKNATRKLEPHRRGVGAAGIGF